MTRKFAGIALAALFAVSIGTLPVNAGLLGNAVDKVKDAVDKTVDKVEDTVDRATGGDVRGAVDNVVTINDTDDDALVDIDTGDGSIATATVGAGGGAQARATIGGLLSPNAVAIDLGGLDLDIEVDVGVGTPNPNNPNSPNNPGGGPILVGSLGGGSGGGRTFVVACAVENTRTLLQIAVNGKVTGAEVRAWQRSSNVQVVPIALCPQAKVQIVKLLARSQKINLLRRAVMTDNLIMASLNRSRYDPKDVVAVQRRAGQLVVYVY